MEECDLTGARGPGAAGPKSGPAKAEKSKEGAHRLVVPFEDNRLLPHLLGEYDAHLARFRSPLERLSG